ncbi:MAG: Uma2 family endonuclease [Deltaproteobacteria bacterium]|nr:Uma2 family endonuclease [Deltaproteobacteria bacterium]
MTNPTMLVEVPSPSTELFDRGEKFADYRLFASLQHYVMVTVGAAASSTTAATPTAFRTLTVAAAYETLVLPEFGGRPRSMTSTRATKPSTDHGPPRHGRAEMLTQARRRSRRSRDERASRRWARSAGQRIHAVAPGA